MKTRSGNWAILTDSGQDYPSGIPVMFRESAAASASIFRPSGTSQQTQR
jgi:hypothetical protein